MTKPLTVYVGLLRGVNVGGHNKLAMTDLRALCEDLGYTDVRTFIQSGNVIFTSAKAPKMTTLEAAIKDRFAIETDVIFRNASELDAAVKGNPFLRPQDSGLHVGFAAANISETVVASLDHERFAPDTFEVVGAEVYLFLPNGAGQSKLPAYLARQLKVPVTLRNWKTVTKLAELAFD
ncbi:MAG TPA: DUF1697 domain-containing protein [Acidimicrobiales bacterium]|nr:DUF1697 domain-containing protein [Acidimicrobiales bacterium]